MWMSVDKHLLCPMKDLNSTFLLIVLKCNKLWFPEVLMFKDSFDVVMIDTTLRSTNNDRHILHTWLYKDYRSPCMILYILVYIANVSVFKTNVK